MDRVGRLLSLCVDFPQNAFRLIQGPQRVPHGPLEIRTGGHPGLFPTTLRLHRLKNGAVMLVNAGHLLQQHLRCLLLCLSGRQGKRLNRRDRLGLRPLPQLQPRHGGLRSLPGRRQRFRRLPALPHDLFPLPVRMLPVEHDRMGRGLRRPNTLKFRSRDQFPDGSLLLNSQLFPGLLPVDQIPFPNLVQLGKVPYLSRRHRRPSGDRSGSPQQLLNRLPLALPAMFICKVFFLFSSFRNELFIYYSFFFVRLFPVKGRNHRDCFSRRCGRGAALLQLLPDDLPQPLTGQLPLPLLAEQGLPVRRLRRFDGAPCQGLCLLGFHRHLSRNVNILRIFLVLDLVSLPVFIPVSKLQELRTRRGIPSGRLNTALR